MIIQLRKDIIGLRKGGVMNDAHFSKLLEGERKVDKKRRKKELNKAVRHNDKEGCETTQRGGYKKTKKKFNTLS